jgi:hypothetical protein
MGKTRKGANCLESLIRLALPVFKRAEKENPRTGPGPKPTLPDWYMAVLIMIGVFKKKKSKSSQYRHLLALRKDIAAWTGEKKLPARATFFRRYRRAKTLFGHAIKLQGELAIAEKIVDPTIVTIDKSLLASRGDVWHKSDKIAGKKPAGVDAEAAWGYSEHHGWVYGYSYEVVVSSMADRTVFPLLASVDVASMSEMKSCPDKIANLPAGTLYVLMDSGYDSNALGEQVEYDAEEKRTGRRCLCPENPRNNRRTKTKPCGADKSRAESRRRRQERKEYLKSKKGKRLYARRTKTVEPFNEWLKSLFELDGGVWHRGLENNQTQVLAAIFAYQLLVRYNYKQGRRNGQIRWILDTL